MGHISFYIEVLQHALGPDCLLQKTAPVSGGSINHAVEVKTNKGKYFLKWQTGIPDDMFSKEVSGLNLLREAGINTPEIISLGKIADRHFLLLAYLTSGYRAQYFWEDFGSSLAVLHQANQCDKYGLPYPNYIGRLPQPNEQHDDWIRFFIENRLEYQLQLAIDNRLVSKDFIELYRAFYKQLPGLLPVEPASLLHGDLWGGNFLVDANGSACLFDPAVYFGNREIELAFTRMFGGFDERFYHTYHEAFPLQPGFENRVEIYNIYPHMVHANMFGTSYLRAVEDVLRKHL